MAETPLYVGIDLGTTNSAAAVFDGERVSVVRNAQGDPVACADIRNGEQAAVQGFVNPDGSFGDATVDLE